MAIAQINLYGLGSYLAFVALLIVSLLAILVFVILGWIKSKNKNNPYLAATFAAVIPLAVGIAGISITDHLNSPISRALDNWGTICIIIATLGLSFLAGIKMNKKVNKP